MQKTFCIVWLFVCSLTFAFGQRQHKATDWTMDGLHGKVKMLTVKEYAPKSDTAKNEELIETSVRYYDELGYLSEIKEVDNLGVVQQRQVFVYTKKRNQLQEMLYDEEGKLLEKTVAKLNYAGNPTQSATFDERGKRQQKTVYEYNARDQLLQQSGYDEKGKLTEKSYYAYNEKGLLCKYLGFGEYENKKIIYKYDADKNSIEMLVYHSKTNAFLEKITQQFDAKKNIVAVNYWDENNVLKSSVLYKYDEKGNQSEYSVLDADKNIQDAYLFVYQYDNQNNWISQLVYKGKDKQAESRMERTIEYYE